MHIHHIGVRVDDLEDVLIDWMCTWGFTLEWLFGTAVERCVCLKKGEVRLELVETMEQGASFHLAFVGIKTQVTETSAALKHAGFVQTDEMMLPSGEQAYYFISGEELEVELVVIGTC
ncbi:hypothetical protein NSQ26_13310 [Bacillus sp. FSL W7-1360]